MGRGATAGLYGLAWGSLAVVVMVSCVAPKAAPSWPSGIEAGPDKLEDAHAAEGGADASSDVTTDAGGDVHAASVDPFGLEPGLRGERVRVRTTAWGRSAVNVGPGFDLERPTLAIVYATPNGNTLEETLGRRRADGEAFRYDIQHVLAQTRLLRSAMPDTNVVLAVVEEKGLSWPTWVKHEGRPTARSVLAEPIAFLPSASVVWASHSGGGSLVLAAIQEAPIPSEVTTVAFLDSHYAFEEGSGHGRRLAAWLRANEAHRLVAIAYDDRRIRLHGRPVVSKKGGSFRATDRLRDALRHEGFPLSHDHVGPFDRYLAASGRVDLRVHPNRENRILHSALVSDENGFAFAVALGRGARAEAAARFGRPRLFAAYEDDAPPASTPSGDAGARPSESVSASPAP